MMLGQGVQGWLHLDRVLGWNTLGAREIDGDRGSLSELGIDEDAAAGLFCDSVDLAQAQAGSASHAFTTSSLMPVPRSRTDKAI